VTVGCDRPFFFVHVMKTGGTTFRGHLRASFEPEEVYPNYEQYDHIRVNANFRIANLVALAPERRERIRVYMGHFPFVAVEILGIPATTFTILRDPVDRIVSYLKQRKRLHDKHRRLELEEIYEDERLFPRLMHNHQAKVFAMTRADDPQTVKDVIEIDDRRLETAKANLETVDVVGLNDHYGEFLAELEARYGFHFDEDRPRAFVSHEPWKASAALRRRIAADNAADLEFYEFAKQLHARRRAAAGA
jgi:hypothetical protein